MIQAVIFDWAGTLADDIHTTLAATNDTLRHFGGEPVDLETYRREFRIPVDGFYDSRIPGHTLEEIDAVFFARYREQVGDIALFPGVAELLARLHGRGLALFLLSTVPTRILADALAARGLTELIDGIYGGAADKTHVLPGLLEEHALARDRTLFVGDSVHDLETAAAAHVRSGAALWGYGLEADLRAAGPDYAFASLDELSSALDREHLLDTVPLVIATVGGVILDGNGRFLVVRTIKWSNTFGIPGGKIDYGETMQQAYEREIREECNLALRDTRFVMIQDCIESPEFIKPRHFLLINYLSTAVDPRVLRWNYEIEEARWVTLEEAFALPLNQPTRVVLDECRRLGYL